MSELAHSEVLALNEALEDEYQAWATYHQVIADFGEINPFVNIRVSEARHIDALITLFHRYGLPVPQNSWLGRAPRFSSVREACEAAVAAEIANAALYERLFAATSRSDILTVFQRLNQASQQRHLPAFRRCADRDDPGRGYGPRRRRRGKISGSHHPKD